MINCYPNERLNLVFLFYFVEDTFLMNIVCKGLSRSALSVLTID